MKFILQRSRIGDECQCKVLEEGTCGHGQAVCTTLGTQCIVGTKQIIYLELISSALKDPITALFIVLFD